jgi:DNA-binding transcriptional LysR family regulator
VKPALTLQQFRGACAVIDSGFNVSRAATRLHTTQSAVSKTIKGLEDDLGAAIFRRSAIRMTGLTEYGQEFAELARRILRDTDAAVARARTENRDCRGVFRIATTHVHAKYTLPAAMRAFRATYPDVAVQIEQGHGSEVSQWVAAGQVQLGISVLPQALPGGLVTLPAMALERCLVVPRGHALLSIDKPSLADIARYRLVCYNPGHPSATRIRALFHEFGLEPEIAMCATDASVIKEFVAAGEGVAILHRIALEAEADPRVAVIDARHIVPDTQTNFVFRQGEYLRDYVYDLIEKLAPAWTRGAVAAELTARSRS